MYISRLSRSIVIILCFLFSFSPLFSLVSSVNHSGNAFTRSHLGQEISAASFTHKTKLVENLGQIGDINGKPASDVLFKIESDGLNIFVTEKGLAYVFYSSKKDSITEHEHDHNSNSFESEDSKKLLNIEWVNMILKNATIKKGNVIKFGKSEEHMNYFYSHCPNGIYNVYSYDKVIITDVYPGIDWVFYNVDDKGLKYDFVVHPGANYKDIEMLYESSQPVLRDETGNLNIKTGLGYIHEQAPYSYLQSSNSNIKSAFNLTKLSDQNSLVKFDLGEVNSGFENIIIDPQLVWGTYFPNVEIEATCVNNTNYYATGTTANVGLPVVNPGGHFMQTTKAASNDVFILKFSTTGILQWCTYYGGIGYEVGTCITSDANNLFIGGYTDSNNFPLSANPGGGVYYNNVFAAQQFKGFLLKFSASGVLQWSTYFGGNTSGFQYNFFNNMTTDNQNNLIVIGYTNSTSFPTFNAFQSTSGGSVDMTLSKFSNNGTLTWSTYLGSNFGDYGVDVSCDASNNVYLVGHSGSPNFPLQNVAGSYFSNSVTMYDGVMAKMSPTGSLLWSTFFGGSANEDGVGIECDKINNECYVVFKTQSQNMFLQNNGGYFQNSLGGNNDYFIVKLNSLNNISWATYYGGTNNDAIGAANGKQTAVDNCGNLYFIGTMKAWTGQAPSCLPSFQKNAMDNPANASFMCNQYLSKFSNSTQRLWATYIGGNGDDHNGTVAVNKTTNDVYVGQKKALNGSSAFYNTAHPGGGAYFNSTGGNTSNDAWILKFVYNPPTYQQSQTNPSACVCNGVASISVTCGEAPYSYQWSNAVSVSNTTLTSHSITGLCPGVYQVTVTSSCNYTYTTTYTITGAISNLSVNSTVQNASCISPTGSVTINSVTNGIPNYTLAQGSTTLASGFNTPYTFGNVAVGLHTYVLTSTNGCSTTFTVQILPGGSPPNVTATTPVTLNCVPNTATLMASSTSTGVLTYTWSGPSVVGGGNTATATVNAPGNYTVIIAQGSCTNSAIVNVIANTNTPNISINTPAVLNCTNTSVVLTGTSTTSAVTYSWSPNVTGPASLPTATANSIGNYTLTVTNTLTGCSSQSVVTVIQNALTPLVNAIATNTLNCLFSSAILTATSSTSPLNYQWSSGPNSFSYTVNSPGSYTVTVTNPANGCTNTAVVSVLQNTALPTATANSSSSLNCITNSATLTAASNVTNATYNWTSGPSSYTYTIFSPSIYTVTATNPSNGCSSQATVAVTQNTVQPNISATVSNTLNCLLLSANLNGTSTTSGVTFSWSPNVTGPASLPTAIANSSGNYTLIVTDPSNGCKSQSVVTVSQNTLTPNVSAGPNQTITCTVSSVPLNGSSSTTGATFSWSPNVSGPANLPNATASSAGNYTLTVTNPVNGCTALATVSVSQNSNIPVITATANGSITCTNTSAILTATSSIAGSQFNWQPINVNTATAIAVTAGNYTVIVTNTISGCTSSAVVAVVQNTATPSISVAPVGTLTCVNPSVVITATSNFASAVYQWNSITTNQPTYTATIPGNVILSLLNPATGCISSSVIAVSQNTTAPNISITQPATLTCLQTSVVLNGSSSTSGATYSWSSNVTGHASLPTATANSSGNYTLTVTDPLNGCKSQSVVTVTQNTQTPNVNAGPNQTITCSIPSVTLNGSSTTTGATFTWSPQNVNTATVTANSAGNYTLTVTDPSNGCVSSATVSVIQNGNLPNISINAPAVLNCTNTSIVLTATSNISNANYQWTNGPSSYTYTIFSQGNYTLTVTDPISGCSSTSVVSVTQNTVLPTVTANSTNSLNCLLQTATLAAISTNTNLVFVWNGGSLSNASDPAMVSVAGSYSVTATDPSNGCSTQSLVTVQQSTLAPTATANSSGNLNCNTTSVTLTGSSTTSGVTYSWSPNVFGPANLPTATANSPGSYSLVVLNTINGCTNSAVVTVSATSMFTANVSVLSQINCFGQNTGALSINNLGGGSSPFTITNLNTSNTIANINSFPVTLNNLSAGNYSIQTTDANGCKQTVFSTITQPSQLNVSVVGNSTLCAGSSASITSNANGGTAPYNFLWTPNAGNGPNVIVNPNVNTTYTLTVTDNNGCKAYANIAIIVSPKPSANIINNKLIGCSPVCANFSLTQNQNSSYTYNWYFNSSSPTPTALTINEYDPELCFTTPGVYDASILITTPEGCSTTITYTAIITVYSKPVADFYFTPEKPHILDAHDVNFFNQSTGATSYHWYNVNYMFSQQTNPTYVYQDPGTFLVTLIASNAQCSDTISKNIIVEDEFNLYIPNTFTPNDDNVNDLFYPVMSGPAPKNYNFMIFDRWGALIYKSNNPNETQWNGYYKNGLCKDDTYVWKLIYTNAKGKAKELTGHVLLMK